MMITTISPDVYEGRKTSFLNLNKLSLKPRCEKKLRFSCIWFGVTFLTPPAGVS